MSLRQHARKALLKSGLGGRLFGEVRYQRMRRRGLSPELQAAVAHLDPGSTIIDVGAAKGGYAYAFAKAVGATGRVIACEPNPDSFHELVQCTWALPVDARQTGVGSSTGQLTLHVPRSSNAGIDAGLGTFTGAFDDSDLAVHVPVTTIDDLATSIDRVDVIKIDVEGWELEVLQGATETIERFRPTLVVECERRHLRKIGAHEDALFALVKAHRYNIETIGHDQLPARNAFDAQDAFNAGDATSYFSGTYPNNFLLTPMSQASQ